MNRLIPPLLMLVLAWGGSDPVTGPAGIYTVKVTTTGPTTITQGEGFYRIEWEVEPSVPDKPNPPVVKPPDPGIVPTPPVVTPPPVATAPPMPDPGISPITGELFLAIIYDSTAMDKLPRGQQLLAFSNTIGPALAKAPYNATWSRWDKSDGGLTGWEKDPVTTFPSLLVIWNAGKSSKSYPGPADEAAALAFAGKLRGQ